MNVRIGIIPEVHDQGEVSQTCAQPIQHGASSLWYYTGSLSNLPDEAQSVQKLIDRSSVTLFFSQLLWSHHGGPLADTLVEAGVRVRHSRHHAIEMLRRERPATVPIHTSEAGKETCNGGGDGVSTSTFVSFRSFVPR